MGKAFERIPAWLKRKGDESKVFFLDLRNAKVDWQDASTKTRIAGILKELQLQAFPSSLNGPAIIKVHIGEPLIKTSILPELAESSLEFLKSRGVKQAVFGDTTVLYSSPRGGKENPHGAESPYLKLAESRGWTKKAPFVVLDRPATSVKGIFEFSEGALTIEAGPPGRYANVFTAGALASAGCLVQHAHMTGHLLTGLACCVKGIAMGLANRRGKAQMHLSLRPVINKEMCEMCGECAESCPEGALDFEAGDIPQLDEERCIGCGQCLAQCEVKAIEMKGLDNYSNYDWSRGSDTIHARMTDYVIGIMQGLWDSSLHIAHLVRMTANCDCYNKDQSVICDDIGFLVGRNPFAVDKCATELLIERMSRYADDDMNRKISAIRRGDPWAYAHATYSIISDADLEVLPYKASRTF